MTEPAKTVDQALLLLATIADDGGGSTRALADRLDLNRTVTHRLLITLERRGFVWRGADGWELGLTLAGLGQAVRRSVRDAARAPLERLSRSAHETALLSVPDGAEAVAVDQVIATGQQVQVRYRPGYRHPLSRGAHGLALLAFADPALVDQALTADPEPKKLRARLARVRNDGYAVTHNELQFGAAGIAAPVFDGPDGAVCASLGVVAPVERFPADRQALASAVTRATTDVTERLAVPPYADRQSDASDHSHTPTS